MEYRIFTKTKLIINKWLTTFLLFSFIWYTFIRQFMYDCKNDRQITFKAAKKSKRDTRYVRRELIALEDNLQLYKTNNIATKIVRFVGIRLVKLEGDGRGSMCRRIIFWNTIVTSMYQEIPNAIILHERD